MKTTGMKKIWLIAWSAYRTRVRSGSFLFLTFIIPVMMIAVGVIAAASVETGEDARTIGYIDQTGQMADIDHVETENMALTMVPASDAAQAHRMFLDGQVSGYLLIPEGYFSGEAMRFFGEAAPGPGLGTALEQFMRRAIAPDLPDEVLDRLEDPANFSYIGLESGVEITSGLGLAVRLIIPLALAIVYSMAILFTTSQMGSAVVREKDQRAMEIVITSLRPRELVFGKVLGISLLTLTQFTIWVLGGTAAILLATSSGMDLQTISIPWRAVLWGLLLIIPGYLLFAVIGAGLGIIAGDSQQAQQLAGFFGLFGFVPIWFISILISNPHSTASVGLTLFPLTSPAVALIRMAFTEVPVWQLAAAVLLLVLSLLAATWSVARIFRAAMLVYGQALRPRQVWRALRQT